MDDDLKKYLSLFVSEASEHVDQLARQVQHLADPAAFAARPDLIDELFRHAHSVKGMSAAMSFDEIVGLAHAAEQLLGDLQKRRVPLPAPLVATLTETTDRLAAMIQARSQGTEHPAAPQLIAALSLGASASSEPPPPTTVAAGQTDGPEAPALSEQVTERLRTVRVRTELLDAMLETAGELLLGVERLRVLGSAVEDPHRQALEEGVDRLQRRVRELHGQVTQARLTPLSILTDQLPRHVREISRRTNRPVELTVSGAEVEIDRSMVEDMADVLLHLLRNSIDHGIESLPERNRAGKPAQGRVAFRAVRDHDRLLLELSDDGRGFDAQKLRRAAVTRGLLSEAEAADLSDDAAILLACTPGLTTAAKVTDISGRGVGLDAVKATVESFGGSFGIESRPGQGSTFYIDLPLSLSLVPVLLAEVAGEVVALPIAKVQAAVDLPPGGGPLTFGGRNLEVQELDRLLGFPKGPPSQTPLALVMGTGDDSMAVAIDRLIGQQEAVIKPLSRPLDQIAGLAGVTMLGSGQPVFIVEVSRLVPRL